MSTWFDEEISVLKARDDARRKAREWHLHKSEVLASRAPEIWERIREMMGGYVKKHNAAWPDGSRALSFKAGDTGNDFEIAADSYPSRTLRARLRERPVRIEYQFFRSAGEYPSEAPLHHQIQFDLRDDGAVCFTWYNVDTRQEEVIDIDGVCATMLRPLLRE